MKFSKAAVAGLLSAVVAGCSTLPTGFSSRSKANLEDLFTSDEPPVQTDVATAQSTNNSGLRIRKSDRGNMKSYVVRGQRYHTLDSSDGYSARGLASWYGPNFHGQVASNGETYDMYKMTAAHKTLPLPTYARVTHLDSGKSVVVKINDRGPFSGDRLIDLSFAAALQLGMVNDGTAKVEIQALSAPEVAELSGPDNKLGVDFYTDEPEVIASADIAPVTEVTEGSSVVLPGVEAAAPAGAAVKVAVKADGQGELLDLEGIESDLADAGTDQTDATKMLVRKGGTVQSGKDVQTTVIASNNAVSNRAASNQIKVVVDAESTSEVRKAAGLPVDLIENTSVGQPVALTGIAAVQAAGQTASGQAVTVPSAQGADPVAAETRKPSGPGFYIQAGVYADVKDAEKVAVDVVLAVPLEEVHVKPLKGTEMYRITVGPIIRADHAAEVSGKLDDVGLENYTVKVKEI